MKNINIKQDLLLYLRALITDFKIRQLWQYVSQMPSFSCVFTDKHSILSITNDSYTHLLTFTRSFFCVRIKSKLSEK